MMMDGETLSPEDVDRRNSRKLSVFEEYFYAQNWLSEREHYTFLSTLRRPLPVCFRIRTEAVAADFQQLLAKERAADQARQLPGGAWQLPQLAVQAYPKIRQWLVAQTAQGGISRQEFVSMIPVLLLDIQSHHCVLDLCASPGSKTIQALDALYASSGSSSSLPTGFVMANELDPRRAYVLSHRCRETLSERMVSLGVACHNACKFPNVLAPLQRSSTGGISERPFDRIICDVPCSGDGTLRKDVKVWKSWHPTYGIQLHALQVRIAKRGLALLKIGGLMTYSTCSFHPIENEAVVAALLGTGCVKVVSTDHARSIEGIRRRSGLTDWKVLDDDGQEVRPQNRPEWPSTLWPDGTHHRSLQRCIRMVPHDNDSGGFFVALLQKIEELPRKKSTNGARKAPVSVTTQAEHHKLFPVDKAAVAGNTLCVKVFTRGDTGKRQFLISNSLAHHLTEAPGSEKLNLVYAGYCPKVR
jgi:16S rRNA C967 or C1407 C5-methylase (RsmB/RsmF family)